MKVARRFGDPRLGEGFDALMASVDAPAREAFAKQESVDRLIAAGVTPELDAAVRALPDDRRAPFAQRLLEAVQGADPQAVRDLVRKIEA
jgi:hypothetical protein